MPRSNQACITTFRFVRYWIFSFDIWKPLELSDKQNHIFMETSSNSRNNNLKTRWATSKVELFKSKRDVWRKYRLFLDDVELGEVHMIHFLRGIFYTAISLSFRRKNLWSWFWKLPTCSWALFSTQERRELTMIMNRAKTTGSNKSKFPWERHFVARLLHSILVYVGGRYHLQWRWFTCFVI